MRMLCLLCGILYTLDDLFIALGSNLTLLLSSRINSFKMFFNPMFLLSVDIHTIVFCCERFVACEVVYAKYSLHGMLVSLFRMKACNS